jgi:hypothetical protein
MTEHRQTSSRQRGAVFLWRYRENRRNYPGWNIAADDQGCEWLLELLERLREAGSELAISLRVARPTESVLGVPKNMNGKARWSSRESLSVRLAPRRLPEDTWTLKADSVSVTITAGRKKLDELRRAVADMRAGEGDYAVGPARAADAADCDDQCLYIWPLAFRRAERFPKPRSGGART